MIDFAPSVAPNTQRLYHSPQQGPQSHTAFFIILGYMLNYFGLADTSFSVPPPAPQVPPKNVPRPTPINLPECRLRCAKPDSAGPCPAGDNRPSPHLSTVLQQLTRPVEQLDVAHIQALGVHVNGDATIDDLIPDLSCLPDFSRWDALSREEALALDVEPRPRLCNDKVAPGATKYVELRHGLLTDNDGAFRAVRRISPRQGEQYVKLGYCHEFFRNLERLTSWWDDTSITKKEVDPNDGGPSAGSTENSTQKLDAGEWVFYRTSEGHAMPFQCRTDLVNAFLKLVTYDFSCTGMSRQEPRLYVKGPPSASSPDATRTQKHSFFPSGCSFLYRLPTDRDSAKKGILEGPVAAVSPRHTTTFPPNGITKETLIDFSREILAALITAQHRAREGKSEDRIGIDAWWATKPRWGGAPGGPIDREIELLEAKNGGPVISGDKDERLGASNSSIVEGEGSPSTPEKIFPSSGRRPDSFMVGGRPVISGATSSSSPSTSPLSGALASASFNPNKRARKGLAIYDAYRMVRPPSRHWDPKTRYAAIGRQRGVDYDDIFVISCVFHHISILRVRVPDRLLDVLAGATPDPGIEGRGRLEIWRTRWYDFFIPQDRLEAMRAVWAVVAYAMRRIETEEMDVNKEGEGGPDGSNGKKDSPRR